MMKPNYLSFLIFSALISLVACKPGSTLEDIDIDYGYEYFPLEVGKFVEYKLDSIVYDTVAAGVVRDTFSWFSKEEIVDTFTDLNNDLSFRIERTQRKTAAEPWQIAEVYSATRTTDQAIKVENNFRFIKMVFPLEQGDIWDGNLFIDDETIFNIAGESVEVFKSWAYELDDIDQIDVVSNMPFDSVMTIYQANNQEGFEPNLIELRYSLEKYARGVGLIYREMRILDTQCIADCIGDPWEDKAQKGFILLQRIIDHN